MSWSTPYWSSVADFLAMGGYAPYVWGSFGVTAGVIVMELWGLRLRRKALATEIDE
jgi:heme exporter protein D